MENLFIKQIMVGPMMNYAYLVGDNTTKMMALIDPGWEGGRLINEAKKAGFKITHILLTHTHFDHANEAGLVAGKLNAPVYVHRSEALSFDGVPEVVEIDEGDHIKVGNMEISILHTPGHTVGSVCYIVDDTVFVGDTLFIDNIGRTDLEGGDSEQMFESLAKLRGLPDKVIVYPGHHYGVYPTATIGEQKKTNPYLKCTSLSDFLRMA